MSGKLISWVTPTLPLFLFDGVCLIIAVSWLYLNHKKNERNYFIIHIRIFFFFLKKKNHVRL
jgi:hypothetical protein